MYLFLYLYITRITVNNNTSDLKSPKNLECENSKTNLEALELIYEKDKYYWNILDLCELRQKNLDEMSSNDRHKVCCSREEDEHEYGVCFLVHKDMVNPVLGAD